MSKKMLQAAAGNAGESLYVEDVFSTYLYEGTGATQSIDNGIDLDGEGGMVYAFNRSVGTGGYIYDTERGKNNYLATASANAEAAASDTTDITSFNSNGFSLGGNYTGAFNRDNDDIVSWTFRKAEKFFDVVTYTGNGTLRNIPHNLGSTPAVIIVKSLSHTNNWYVQHTSLGPTKSVFLDTTSAATTRPEWGNTAPTDSVFTVDGTTVTATNYSGRTYVAYLFASDAGGFGDDGSESIIKCGSYTGNGSTDGPEIDLGFEPQWLLFKNSDSAENWFIFDVMRGWTAEGSTSVYLRPHLSNAESSPVDFGVNITSTGFKINTNSGSFNTNGDKHIYIAIRRPMKTPESGTEVFAPNTIASSVPDGTQIDSGFAIDMNMTALRGGAGVNFVVHDRLRGVSTTTTNGGLYLETSATQAENTGFSRYFNNTGFQLPSTLAGSDLISYSFKRATGFFDVVAYTGDGTNPRTINHNLGVTPELMIIKDRTATWNWFTFFEFTSSGCKRLFLNLTNSEYSVVFSDTGQQLRAEPTDSIFTVGSNAAANASGDDYIAYLFATVAGVSKVGSYTGTGASQNIDCGFSSGARFIMIKRTDAAGDWWVWDTARGIVAGNDPFLQLNNTSAEVTATDYIDPLSSGFILDPNGTGATGLNASGGSYIFLAIS